MAKKGVRYRKYSPKFKITVIMDMRENHLSYCETVRKYWKTKTKEETNNYRFLLRKWERKYIEEGKSGFYIERRGRTRKVDNPKKGRPRSKPLDPNVKKDLIAENRRLKEENQYLKAEMAYLKKLDALIRAEEQKSGKKQK